MFHDVATAIESQKRYTQEHDVPMYAPPDGICPKCRSQIYSKLGHSVTYASMHLVTGCPFCHYSFTE